MVIKNNIIRSITIMQPKKLQHGFTLLEILIAVLISAIGLLGLAGLTTTALQLNQSSYQRTQAIALMEDLLDRIRVNRNQANNYARAFSDPVPTINTDCRSNNCTPTQLASFDLADWFTQVQQLPGAAADIEISTPQNANTINVTIQLRWNERGSDPNQATQPQTFRMSSQL